MTRIFAGFIVMSISGCDCLFPPEPEGTGGGSGGGGEQFMLHQECAGVVDEPDLAAATAALKTPGISDGVQEAKLSANGCVVLRRQFSGGRLTALSLLRYLGYPMLIDGGVFDPVFTEAELRWVDATFGPGGQVAFTLDSDGDTKRDYAFEEELANGQLVRRQTTRFSASTGNVLERTTLTPAAGSLVHWKVENTVSGALATVFDADVPSKQNQTLTCYQAAPGGTSDTVPCPISEAAVRTRLHEAVARFSSCLSGLGADGFSVNQLEAWLLDAAFVDSVPIECFQANDYFGQMQLKENVLRLNAGMLGSCEGENFTTSTIIHELLHRTRGPHEFDSPSGPYGPRAAAYSDPARACEELCFGTLKTKCSCARCLGVKACDTKCGSLPGCKATNDAGMATMSEAVGAHCQSNNTWFATMASCMAAGACASGKCKSYSVSCDPSCQ